MDPQCSISGAKPDTVFVNSVLSRIVDVSQYNDGLTASTTAGYETSSALRAVTGATGREIYVRASVSNADTNMEWVIHASSTTITDNTYRIYFDGSKNIVFAQGSTTLYSVASTVGLVGSKSISAHWSTRPNPDTTGAGDALISEFLVYNHTDSVYLGEIVQVTHAVPTTDVAWAFTCGGWYDASPVTRKGGGGTTTRVRIGKAWHTATEFAEDWIAARTAHSSQLADLLEPLPISFVSELGNESEWAGQANVGYCAASANANRGRMVSNLINEVYSDARTLTNTPSPTQWLAGPPGGSTVYRLDVTKLRWLPHPGTAMAWVRVHVQSWVTAGAAVPIGIRVYAFNRPPLGVGPTIDGFPTPPLDYDFVFDTLTADHGSGGVGVWLELGLLRLPRFNGLPSLWTGTTTLCLAHAFDPAAASGNDANARLKIKAWHVRPVIGLG